MSDLIPRLPQPTPEEIAPGADAIREEAALAADIDLDDRTKLNSYNNLLRDDKTGKHLHRITIWGIYVTFSLYVLMLFVIVLEYVLPSEWKFLNPDDLAKLQGFLMSGVIGSALADAREKILKGGKKS